MTEWIWGRQPVLEALRAGRAEEVLVSSRTHSSPVIKEIQAAAEESHVPVRIVNQEEILQRAHTGTAQGIAARVHSVQELNLEDLLTKSAGRLPLLLVLDGIQDPHNLGSLFRSAEVAGATGVVVTRRRSAPISPTVVKASSGAVYHLPLAVVTNVGQALQSMAERGIWRITLEAEAAQSIFECDLTLPSALILGNEGKGVRRLTSQRSDLAVSIPRFGRVASLNVSVAGAIALFEAQRQRTHGDRLLQRQ